MFPLFKIFGGSNHPSAPSSSTFPPKNILFPRFPNSGSKIPALPAFLSTKSLLT